MNVIDRFIDYCKIHTTSADDMGVTPSTKNQFDLGNKLVAELKTLGLQVEITENCYVYAKLPANNGSDKTLGLIAHVDTSNAVSGENVVPQIIRYDGGDITLPTGLKIELDKNPALNDYIGQDIITSQGDTLLGCDDKGGVAIIMQTLETLVNNPEIPHPALAIAFTPDEEIGLGTVCFDTEKFGADFAYTVDGGKLGELEYENFNAAACDITINGKSFHPGDSKGKMINAVNLSSEFIAMLPSFETPSTTEGYEGFYHVDSINGDVTKINMSMIIRDHSKDIFDSRKAFVKRVCDFLNDKYGKDTFICKLEDSYYNMKEQILPYFFLIENAKEVFLKNGIAPIVSPIRGGTDGARLSYMGLPTPNISTGGHNFHGYQEYVPVDSLKKMVDVVVDLVQKY